MEKEIKSPQALGKSKGQSIVNNFHSVSDNKYGAGKAKFFLKKLRELTGVSEQRLIVELILDGFETSPMAAEHKDAINRAWAETIDNNK